MTTHCPPGFGEQGLRSVWKARSLVSCMRAHVISLAIIMNAAHVIREECPGNQETLSYIWLCPIEYLNAPPPLVSSSVGSDQLILRSLSSGESVISSVPGGQSKWSGSQAWLLRAGQGPHELFASDICSGRWHPVLVLLGVVFSPKTSGVCRPRARAPTTAHSRPL